MKLATQALHPARQTGNRLVQGAVGEIDVGARQATLAQILRQGLQHQQAIGRILG
ncbi:hypothetical protein D3C80_2193740 [compost metagenome]